MTSNTELRIYSYPWIPILGCNIFTCKRATCYKDVLMCLKNILLINYLVVGHNDYLPIYSFSNIFFTSFISLTFECLQFAVLYTVWLTSTCGYAVLKMQSVLKKYFMQFFFSLFYEKNVLLTGHSILNILCVSLFVNITFIDCLLSEYELS